MLAALPLVSLAAITQSAPAATAAETCGGETATVVGPGTAGVLVGTPGDDVIVTHGATDVDALGGDDLICPSETTADLSIDAGDGADRVLAYSVDPTGDRRSAARALPVVAIDLGPGDDVAHVISDDGRTTGTPETGAVDDYTVDGGVGRDRLFLDTWLQQDIDRYEDGGVEVDLTSGTATLSEFIEVGFTGIERYRVEAQGLAYVLGSDGPDDLEVSGCGTLVRAGRGSDTIRSLEPRTDVAEGNRCRNDSDRVEILGGAHGDRIDLETAGTAVGGSGADVIVTSDNCGAFVHHDTCGVEVYGGPGNDRLVGGLSNGERDMLHGGPDDDALYGYGDRDQLIGASGDDRLYGGAGPDTAAGGTGRDLCRAEVRTACER